MGLAGVGAKSATTLSFPRRPAGWCAGEPAERRGARPRRQQRRRRRRWSCMRKTRAAELAGVANQGRRWQRASGRGKEPPQEGAWIEEGQRRLTGAAAGGLGQSLGRGNGGKGWRRRPLFLKSPRLKTTCGWTKMQLQKSSGAEVKTKTCH